MPMPIHIRNPDGMPYQIQSVVTPSRKLSPEDLYKAGAITAKEYLSRTGRLQPADGLASALMPRTAAADDAGTLQQLLAGVSDVASLPGRAYASLGRPAGEPYQSALARLAATQGEGGADRFSEGVLRDPANILAPIGLSALSKIPAVARGLVAAGRYGSLAADVGANTAAQAVANKAIGEDAGVPQSAALNLAFGLGAHGLSGLARSGMRMISPEERAANFKNWFGDSKVVDADGKPLVVYHGTNSDFSAFKPLQHFGTLGAASDRLGMVGGSSESIMPSYLRAKNILEIEDNGLQTPIEIAMAVNHAGGNVDTREIISHYLHGMADDEIAGIANRIGYATPKDATRSEILDDLMEYADKGRVSDLMEKVSRYGDPREGDYFGSFDGAAKLLQDDLSSKYDALSYSNGVEDVGSRSYIALDPAQIKSATGNRGTFDPTDPNITHFAGGPAYPQSLASIAASRIVNSGKQAAAMKAQEQ